VVLHCGWCSGSGVESIQAMTVDDIDIFRSAAAFIEQHGDEAPIHAAMKADDMLERGDMDGRAVWLRIVGAIRDMQRETPRPGEQRH